MCVCGGGGGVTLVDSAAMPASRASLCEVTFRSLSMYASRSPSDMESSRESPVMIKTMGHQFANIRSTLLHCTSCFVHSKHRQWLCLHSIEACNLAYDHDL